jgi:general secretion pathway protein C
MLNFGFFGLYFDSIFKLFNDQRTVFFITLLLTVLLAYQLAIFVWQIVPQPDLKHAVSTNTVVTNAQSSSAELSTQQKVAQISGKHLFGQVERNAAAPVQVQDAPKSSLNYKLRGIYYSSEESIAAVILQKNNLDGEFYRLGDEVDTNIYIHQIQPDHIIISRQGRLEKLILEKPTADMSGNQQVQARTSLPAASSTRILKSYRRRYKDNPMALARRFQAIPVQENGNNIGYKLKALRGESLLKNLALEQDDVFVAINGIGLDKPFQALDALKSLTTANSVSVTVMRNGNRETLDFNLD